MSTHSLFHGGGEMGERMAALDWSKTPLGPVERWPQSLKTAARILLTSRFEMWMAWGPQLPFLYNDAYRRKTIGRKHPRALGMPTRELWSEIWQDIGPRIEHVLRTGEATWDEALLLFLERSGYTEETYHTFSYSPLSDESGKVTGMLSVVTEETERVIAARRLATLRDLASALATAGGEQALFRSVEEALGTNRKDLPFTLTYLYEDGGRRARLVCTTGIEPGHPAAPAAFDCADPAAPWPAAELAAGSGVLSLEYLASRFSELPCGDWPQPPTRAALVPIAHSGQEAAAGFLVAALNRYRPADEAYEGFVKLVAGQIAASLANARAYESERRRAEVLAELDRAKTAFFSNVSHELRTPLTLILGPLEDALVSQARALSGAALETTHRNALRLLKLVNALLEFSRIEAGRVQANFTPTDLSAMTAELASLFRSAIERGGLRLVVDCEKLAEPVYVDPEMWEKIVLNLISNAFKFTHRGEIGITIRAVGDELVLSVSDTGIGIAAQDLPRVFERFHRVQGAQARTHEGSGIGLSLVQELVRLHGGRVEAESAPGVGTIFRVYLRRGCAHLPAERIRRAGGAPAATPGAAAFVEEALRWLPGDAPALTSVPEPTAPDKDTLIVLAEDNADMRDYLVRLLSQSWTVHAVPDGEAALEAVRARVPALVITDVMMPRLDGFGLVRALRAAAETQSVPVLMLSARAGEEARIEGLESGADDYIVKPFSARELLARVSTNLKLSRLRARLQQEQAAMAALFRQSPMPIAVLRGPQLVYELANPPYIECVDGRDVLGRPLLEALPEIAGHGLDALLLEVMRTGQPYIGRDVHVPLRRRGVIEDTYWTFIYAPLRGAGDECDGIVPIGTEVTDQVRARERQQRLIEQAAAASRAKDEFLAMLGHELRNPLSPIATALQLMRLRNVDSGELDIIERQVGHLTRLVDDLLDVSRITRGKIELRRRRVELGEVVSRAIEIASPLLEQRRNRLDVRVQERGLTLDADPERLSQVVSNLLTNAAKYSHEHSRIVVQAERTGAVVRLTVLDHGIGIAPDMLEQIWDAFVQLPQTAERATGGLGLGLAIVRSLVGLHGGRVSATSAGLGQGAQFTVELPAADEHPPVQPAALSETPAAAPNGSKRILLIDDNEDGARTLAVLLRHLGHSVQVAHDGPSALREAEAFPADIALVDIGLPVMDGYELARRLREKRPHGLRLVAITGYGQDADRHRSAEAGFAAHLVKPVDFEALLRALS